MWMRTSGFAAGLALCAAMALVPRGTFAAGGGEAYLRLACTFEDGLHACRGAANPFAASGGVAIVSATDRAGHAARFAGHETPKGERPASEKSALILDGKNVPAVRGTLAFHLRWTGDRHWSDGKRTWLAVLAPRLSHADAALGKKASGLALLKEADNTLALFLYHFQGERLTDDFRGRTSGFDVAPPDVVAIRIPVLSLKRKDWVRVRLAWDQAAGRVWLGVGDRLESAMTPLAGTGFHCLLLGSPPAIASGVCPQRGYDGEMDDLVLEARTPAQSPRAGMALPANPPPMAAPQGGLEPARLLRDDPWGARVESALRTHLRRMLQTQQCGGWAYSVAFPSMLRFLSSGTVIPFTDDFVACAKEQNSAGAALRLLAAYEALGDERLLKAAQKTAALLLALQQPAGHWVYGAEVDPATLRPRWIRLPEIGPFEDHVQTAPILLLWRLHALTGREDYARAAEKGVAFILKGQNPNGSWAHKFDVARGIGQGAHGDPQAGEINDYATTGQMRIMLLAYRRTGNPAYLASFLRGADWLASAFIDKKAKGWAQQYDALNVPIRARHFEPAAVSLSEGIAAVPETLVRAWRLTGDRRYLDPVTKWRAWMIENKTPGRGGKGGGWHIYYDIETGRPIYSVGHKVLPADPHGTREGGYGALLDRLKRLERPEPPYVAGAAASRPALAASRGRVDDLVNSLDPAAGSWTYNLGSAGKAFSPARPYMLPLAAAVFTLRQLRGEIPWSHPLSALAPGDWEDVFHHVLPPARLWKPLTTNEIARARAVTASGAADATRRQVLR